ncbi:GNAT family N-acetyltransferase [Weissella paramesenteroides]|uniref:GNAT family N-acetyltransferase n=1 Tax=Weissella paramesenteroides TaxID=1249 RepID=UPI00103B7502|nr:GNAT family N-acetyltransferase [Weissella paramesenteroides]RZQ58888.1 N-acetyltransferase [Weissella paramesenteroides]
MIEEDSQVKVYIWLAAYRGNDEIAFVYDINIYPDFQNQGLGTQTLALATDKMKQ